jgi:ABC-2 type transport system ATP-binding protein
VSIDGTDFLASPERIRARIGFLPERTPLYEEMSVSGFLNHLARLRGLSGAEAKRRVGEVMAQTEITERADHEVATLSHGFRKRVGIAQAIVHKPTLVILDEPISGLDPVQIVGMRKLIRSLRGDHTVLISSHILTEVHETCDRLLMLKNGELVASGTEEEIRQRYNPVRTVEVVVRGDGADVQELLDGLSEVDKAERQATTGDLVTFKLSLAGDDREAIAAAIIGAGFGLRRLDTAENELEEAFLAMNIKEGAL